MDNSQFFVLTHKHLESQHPVEIWNIDNVEIESYVSFIYKKKKKKKIQEAKPQLERRVIS